MMKFVNENIQKMCMISGEKKGDKWEIAAIESRNFNEYQLAIMRDRLKTLLFSASILIPLFFVLDIFIMPPALLHRFAIYRLASLTITIIQRIVVQRTKPSRWSYLHGYLLSSHAGIMITLMTVDLGGFNSSYYAVLNLLIIGVSLMIPWRAIYTFFNAFLIISIYFFINILSGHSFEMSSLLNNIFFLGATSALSIGINSVRLRLIHKEFSLLIELGKARNDLQNEKEKGEDKAWSLKSLLDISGQGFLSFNSNFIISSEYSRECRNIFGREIEGLQIDEMLFNDPKAKLDFRMGLGLFFGGKSKPEVIFDHLDKTIAIGDKTVKAEYKAIHVNRIMLILTDITEEVRLQEESRRETEKWEMLRKVITNKQAFGSFDREAKILFSCIVNHTKGNDLLLQDIHTLKGNAGFLGFIMTQKAAHEFEEFLTNKIALGESIDASEHFDKLTNSFAIEMANVMNSMGASWRLDVDSIEVSKSEYLLIEDHIKTYCPNPALINAMEEHRKKPLLELISRFPKMAEQISLRLGKRINPMYIIGGSLKVISDDFEDLIESFTHIIRNSIDHGIEPPAEREKKGKSAAGTMGIEIEDNANEITFKFSDDGRGIQFDEIEKRAKKLGFIKEGKKASNNDLLPFIFRDNFSTISNISEISGRGIGLAAVRTAVKKMGGQIRVKTWKDRGTIFTIIIPIFKSMEEA